MSLWTWLAFLFTNRPHPTPPPAPTTRAVGVIVCTPEDVRLPGAAVWLDDLGGAHTGTTDHDGYCEFAAVSTDLSASQLKVEAAGFVTVDVHLDLTPGINQQIWIGGEPEQATAIRLDAMQPAFVPLVGPHNPSVVACNFGSLWDATLNRAIFQANYPSMDNETRKRWREIAAAAGDTHFQIGNPTTPYEDYHIPAYTNWLTEGRMDEWVACLAELHRDGFTPVVFLDSGDRYPGAGFHRAFVEAIPLDLRQHANGDPTVIFCPGHEIIAGGYTTKQGCDAVREISDVAGPRALIAMHTSDGRLSFSSNPVEADDPFHGDEIACWRGDVGQRITHHFYQSANLSTGEALDDTVPGSPAERTHEVVTRVIGDHWAGAPDWFDGLPRRPYAVLWEQSEELFFKHQIDRAWMLTVARTFMGYGFQGYGCGSPDLLP